MKTAGATRGPLPRGVRPRGVDVALPAGPGSGGEGRTRIAVARLLLEQGPITAAEVAAGLGLSGAAVRRHLDALIAGGEAETRDAPHLGRRSRGRPAKHFLLTDAGRVRFGHGYDDLATSALRFLATHAGEEAVGEFARSRVHELLGGAEARVSAAGGPGERAEALAEVLSGRGYAAATREVGGANGVVGVQLCQHHCPVAHVAAEFPELCEAETEAFAAVLGTHVQRLATIARGDSACTTHVPVPAPERRSGPLVTTTSPRGRQHDDHS